MIRLRKVTKQHQLADGTTLDVLRGINLAIEPGESIAIVGRSGSGKSTLLNLLGLLDRPTSGTVEYGDRDISTLHDGALSALRGESVGFIFQQFHLLAGRTARENVAEPLLFGASADVGGRGALALAWLSAVGLEHRAASRPHQLSGGEQQRVAIARAMVRRPSLILADEPTGSLDLANAEAVLELLFGLTRSHVVSLVIVTHDTGVAAHADRTFELDDGLLYEAQR